MEVYFLANEKAGFIYLVRKELNFQKQNMIIVLLTPCQHHFGLVHIVNKHWKFVFRYVETEIEPGSL